MKATTVIILGLIAIAAMYLGILGSAVSGPQGAQDVMTEIGHRLQDWLPTP